LFPVPEMLLDRPAARVPFPAFFKLASDFVERQPDGGIKIIDGIAFFLGMRCEGPLAGHHQPDGHLEYFPIVPVVLLIDHDFATAPGEVEAAETVRLLPHQLLDRPRVGSWQSRTCSARGEKQSCSF
jgi:hypothetical protein